MPYGREGIATMFVDALDVVVDGWMEVCGELEGGWYAKPLACLPS